MNQRKRLAFLALLAASEPQGIARERVLLLLWPESTAERARAALYQLLYVVRQAFGEDSVTGTDELHLDRSIVASDVVDFNDAVARGDLCRLIDLTGRAADSEHQALLARAWKHRDGLTDYEQLRLEIAYKYSPDGITPSRTEHVERLRRVVERYPNAVDARLLADFYIGARDLSAAERAYRLTIALDSTRVDAYAGVVNAYLKANRLGDARRATTELARRFPDAPIATALDALVSYAEGRRDRTREIAQRLTVSGGVNRSLGYVLSTSLDLLEGRLAAWERGIRAIDSLAGSRPRAPGVPARLLVSYWIMNRPDQALGMLDSARAANASLRAGLEAAELYAQFGVLDSARAILALPGTTRRSTYVQGTDTLPVSAWIDLHEGRPRDGAVRFRESLRFSGGNTPSQISRDTEIGLAFERAALPDSAIAAYEHYLAGSPVLELDAFRLVWVLEHVARLYETKGDRRKAAAAYGRVAELWKNADADLQPRVSLARERAAALR